MSKGKQVLLVCALLAAVTAAAFWPVNHSEFLSYDDPRYVTENPPVLGGLTAEGLRWAFATLHAEFWHPLTWLSHMLDVQLFGLEPRGHHLTNLWFHILNTLLLFLVFQRMTRETWKSAFVAALFAIHPLHVESVAWVAERKDVLSTFFWMLTMGAYVYYVERPGLRRYLAVLLFFVLGLMAKPMLVTLPFALLLLDYWPLRRFVREEGARQIRAEANTVETENRRKGKPGDKKPFEPPRKPAPPVRREARAVWSPLLREKIPLFALAAAASALAYSAQYQQGEAGFPGGSLLFGQGANAFLSYILYIGKTIWPASLGAFYPYPEGGKLWHAGGAFFLFAGITFLVFRKAGRFPYLPFGWLWYAGILVPVIGIVEVGDHAMADRYTYIPLIGLFTMAAWGIPELLKGRRYAREILFLSSGLILSCLFVATWIQAGYWRNGITLFDHTIRVTQPNSISYLHRAMAYGKAGNLPEALKDIQKAMELRPEYAKPYYLRANIQASLGNYQQALADLNKAVVLYPDYAQAFRARADIQAALGRYSQAVEDWTRVIGFDPEDAEAYHHRGKVYARLGDYRRAIQDYDRALALDPNHGPALNNRAAAFESLGDYRRAIADCDKAIEINPKHAEAYNNRGNAYGSLGDFPRALKDLSQAIELNPRYAVAYNNRAAVHGSRGDYRLAIEDCDKAIEINPKYAEAYNNRGNAHARLGDYRRAIQDYDQALALNPNYGAAHNNRAAAHWGGGNREKAIADLKAAARLGYEPAQKSLKSQGMSW